MMPALPIAMMFFGAMLAAFGYSRQNDPEALNTATSARLGFVWDLLRGLVVLLFWGAIAFGPRYKIDIPKRRTSRTGHFGKKRK